MEYMELKEMVKRALKELLEEEPRLLLEILIVGRKCYRRPGQDSSLGILA